MLPQFLTYEACKNNLNWHDAIDALRQGHKLARPQQGDVLLGSVGAQLLNRAAHIEGLGFVIKGDTIFPGNAQKGLPSVQGAVLLYDPHCGSLRAVIESRVVTQYKTAADSVLGAQCLARSDSRHLLIIGAGAVASTLARAYDAVFPGLEQISIWSRRPEQACALAATLDDLRCDVAPVIDLSKAVRLADMVSAATMAQQPVLLGQWVRPGTHIDLIGAFTPDMREADDDLIAASMVYVDYFDTVVEQIGELMQPIRSGVITRDHVRGELYDLVAADGSSRRSDEQITLFKNGGGAHLDLMIANYVVHAVNAAKTWTA